MFPLKWENLIMISTLFVEAIQFVKDVTSEFTTWRYSEYRLKRRRKKTLCYTNLWKF